MFNYSGIEVKEAKLPDPFTWNIIRKIRNEPKKASKLLYTLAELNNHSQILLHNPSYLEPYLSYEFRGSNVVIYELVYDRPMISIIADKVVHSLDIREYQVSEYVSKSPKLEYRDRISGEVEKIEGLINGVKCSITLTEVENIDEFLLSKGIILSGKGRADIFLLCEFAFQNHLYEEVVHFGANDDSCSFLVFQALLRLFNHKKLSSIQNDRLQCVIDAKKSMLKNNYQEALKILNTDDSQGFYHYMLLAEIYNYQGLYDQALIYVRKTLHTHPYDLERLRKGLQNSVYRNPKLYIELFLEIRNWSIRDSIEFLIVSNAIDHRSTEILSLALDSARFSSDKHFVHLVKAISQFFNTNYSIAIQLTQLAIQGLPFRYKLLCGLLQIESYLRIENREEARKVSEITLDSISEFKLIPLHSKLASDNLVIGKYNPEIKYLEIFTINLVRQDFS